MLISVILIENKNVIQFYETDLIQIESKSLWTQKTAMDANFCLMSICYFMDIKSAEKQNIKCQTLKKMYRN